MQLIDILICLIWLSNGASCSIGSLRRLTSGSVPFLRQKQNVRLLSGAKFDTHTQALNAQNKVIQAIDGINRNNEYRALIKDFGLIWNEHQIVGKLRTMNPEEPGLPIPHLAVMKGDKQALEVLQFWIAEGLKITLDHQGRTPWFYLTSLSSNFAESLKLSGVSLDTVDGNGLSPLVHHLYQDSYQICDFLLRNGADPSPLIKVGKSIHYPSEDPHKIIEKYSKKDHLYYRD